jgi:hypothetical protein
MTAVSWQEAAGITSQQATDFRVCSIRQQICWRIEQTSRAGASGTVGRRMAVPVRLFAHRQGNTYMRQIADLVAGELVRSGVDAHVVDRGVPGGGASIDVVVAPHEYAYFEPALAGPHGEELMAGCAALLTEQPGTAWFTRALDLCRATPVLADLSEVAAEVAVGCGLPVEPLGFGYTPLWDRWGGDPDRVRPVDAIVMAAITEHRSKALAAMADELAEWRSEVRLFDNTRTVIERDRWFLRGEDLLAAMASARVLVNVRREPRRAYFEWIRCLPAVLNGAVLLTEPSLGAAPLVAFEDFLPVDAGRMGPRLTALLDDEPLRRTIAASAYERLRAGPSLRAGVLRFLARAEEALGKAAARTVPVERPVALAPTPQGRQRHLHRPPVAVLVPVVEAAAGDALERTVRSALGAGAVRVVVADGTSDGIPVIAGAEHHRHDDRVLAGVVREALEHLRGWAIVLALPGDELYPGALDRLADAIEPAVEAVFGILVAAADGGDRSLVAHLPWDLDRLCRRAYLDHVALVLPGASDLLVELAATAGGPAWERQRPWIELAASGGIARWVPTMVARVSRPDACAGAGPPAPRALRHRFPNLPWPNEEVAA